MAVSVSKCDIKPNHKCRKTLYRREGNFSGVKFLLTGGGEGVHPRNRCACYSFGKFQFRKPNSVYFFFRESQSPQESFCMLCDLSKIANLNLTSQNNPISPPRKSRKIQYNHWPFISGYMCTGTLSFDLPTPNVAGSSKLNSVLGPGPERRAKKVRCFMVGTR